jgi:hypothetical protein
MSIVGRILGVVVGVVLAAGAGLALWLLWAPQPVDATIGSSALSVAITMSERARWAATGALALAELLALGMLFASMRGRSRPRVIELATGEHQSVLVAPSELERQVEQAALDADLVSEAHARVQPVGQRSVAVDLSLEVEPEAELKRVVDDVQQRIATSLSSRYGAEMQGAPKIEVRYARERSDRSRRRHSTTVRTPATTASDERPVIEK